MLEPFEAPKLKIERARAHIQELDVAIRSYLAGKPCVIVVERETDPQNKKVHEFLSPGREFYAAVARVRTPIPPYLSAIIGDVVHNLRASLDLLICDLARVNDKSSKKIYFPFCEGPQHLEEVVSKLKISNRCGEDIAQAIISLKPYRGEENLLRTIHDLDIADKHQALIPTFTVVAVPLARILGGPAFGVPTIITGVLKDGDFISSLPTEIPLGTELPTGFSLAFGDIHEAPGCNGRLVIEFLHALAERTNCVVEALAVLRPGACFPAPSSS